MTKTLPLRLFLCASLMIAVLASCSHKYYTSPSFDVQTAMHKRIAVLPAEMIFTGNLPKNVSPEQIANQEELESTTFQQSLYNNILRHANSRKEVMTIEVQDIGNTKKLLEAKGISTRDSWKKTDQELASILQVDAVVRMRIEKKRYMSDLASMSIGIARNILLQVGRNNNLYTPYPTTKTNDINASCTLLSNGLTLWNDNYQEEADWNKSSSYIIEKITNKFGKHFPYKKKANS